jgi:TDG/mug DNA glycosylase family protein
VRAATARADELSIAELVAGGQALAARVEQIKPAAVAILGISAYRPAFGRPRAAVGRQPVDLGGAQLWVVPNPSGLNAHATIATLAEAYREVAVAAGIDVYPRP